MNADNAHGLSIEENVSLAEFTTLHLGGEARYFCECKTVSDIILALRFCERNGIRLHVPGGGSNTIFSDEVFDGLVIKIALVGMQFLRERDHVRLTAAAGEKWDSFVQFCVKRNLAGVECLSGIPGLVGATPIQNVGAYGQEVSETIVEVKAIDRTTLTETRFSNTDCRFSYRHSRFNSDDANRFIITEVTFRLTEFGDPQIRYPELRKFIDEHSALQELGPCADRLQVVRDAVLSLRRKKSMVIDPSDPNSRSVGSFFKNPILTKEQFAALQRRIKEQGLSEVPTFRSGQDIKVPAAWLVEHAGFPKGFRKGGVGVSSQHSLALVNYDGTTRELLGLAEEIQSTVLNKFGVRLEREPVVVQ